EERGAFDGARVASCIEDRFAVHEHEGGLAGDGLAVGFAALELEHGERDPRIVLVLADAGDLGQALRESFAMLRDVDGHGRTPLPVLRGWAAYSTDRRPAILHRRGSMRRFPG